MKNTRTLTALLEFDDEGELQAIFLNSNTDREEETLKTALSRLFPSDVWSWLARFISQR
jgi:hypothetical protein